MITEIELINYKSFDHIIFDFHDTKTKIKNFSAIYGENGSGKTNFVSSLDLLLDSIYSLSYKDLILQYNSNVFENKNNSSLQSLLDSNGNIFEETLKSARMIDSEENTSIKVKFLLDEIEGYYYLEFNNQIVKEELYYLKDSIRGKLFSIKMKADGTIGMNQALDLISSSIYKKEIKERINMFWGKHTFLSIINSELFHKNEAFVEKNISANLLSVLNHFKKINVYKNAGSNFRDDISISSFSTLQIDESNDESMKRLHVFENLFRGFYTQLYSDITDVTYQKISENNKVSIYSLYITKVIAGKKRMIPFSLESNGTKRLLPIFGSLLKAISGEMVIYDEIDTTIHDGLIVNLLSEINKTIKGQLIITTHNTYLMEKINSKYVYIIYCDPKGYKEARCTNEYDFRIQANNNLRDLYLKNLFGGVPFDDSIDYSFIEDLV